VITFGKPATYRGIKTISVSGIGDTYNEYNIEKIPAGDGWRVCISRKRDNGNFGPHAYKYDVPFIGTLRECRKWLTEQEAAS
jgi:hypothetical protein